MKLERPRPILRQGQWEKCRNVIEREPLGGNGPMDWRFMILKKKVEGIGRPPYWGNIHVYYHDIQRSSLKLLGK